MKKLGLYLLQHNKFAAIIAFLSSLLPFFAIPTAWIASIVIALVTLRKGAKAGAFILIWAIIPGIAVIFKGYWGLLLSTVVVGNISIWIFAICLRETRSWSWVIQLAALIGVIVVFIVHGFVPDLHSWWVTSIKTYDAFMNLKLGNVVEVEKVINFIAQIATGVETVIISLSTLLYLFIARMWQALMFNPGGLRKECYSVRMSKIATIVLLLTVGALVFRVNVAWDIMPVVVLPFVLTGLSILHAYAAKKKKGLLLVVSCYILMLLLFPYILVLLTFIALLDSWYDLRIRYLLI